MNDYTITENDGTFGARGTWSVWLTGKMVRMSSHETRREAKAAVKRYEAADARRANAPAS
jgi:riboflavin biosynthesis pyrimidine reductase